jgi:alpha-tubulin suppressor-like RCC1 family protein
MKHTHSLLCSLCVLLLAACGGGGGSSAPPPVPTVTVTPATASVMVGQQIQLAATTTNATGPVTWATSNTAVATVNSTGLVMALALGQVTITATSGGESGTAALTTTTGIVFGTVTTGSNHTCGLTYSGVAYCWGNNSSGQLGNGTTTNSTTPVPVSGGYSFEMISAGGAHTCGIASFIPSSPPMGGGTLYCWGDNSSGQLGNGMTNNSATPVPVSVSSKLSFNFVSAGGSHTCGMALPNSSPAYGSIGYCWGANSSGQLGNGTTNNSSVPVAISTTPSLSPQPVVLGWGWLSAGYSHTCGTALQEPGLGGITYFSYCWGDNTAGELGDGTTSNSDVPDSSPAVISYLHGPNVSAGRLYSCNATDCWGNNSSGQLGNGTMTNSSVAVPITGAAPNGSGLFDGVNPGGDHTCALTNPYVRDSPVVGGIAYCWGGNSAGQLGNGTMTNSTTPIVVAGGLVFAVVSAGDSHTCGVTIMSNPPNPPTPIASGGVYCWGDNTYGQLGNSWTTSSPVPVNVAGTPN